MPSAGDQPGWQPDPSRPGMLRWWNGLGWSDAYRAPDDGTERARRAAAEAHRVSTVTPQQVSAQAKQAERTIAQRVTTARQAVDTTGQRVVSAKPPRVPTEAAPLGGATGRARGRKTASGSPGVGAVVLGVLGLILGLYGIVSAIGFLVSLQALARSRTLAQRGAARTGIVASLIGLVLSAVGLLMRLPDLIAFVQSIAVQVQQ